MILAGAFGMNGTLTHTGIILGLTATAVGLTKPIWSQVWRAFQRTQQFLDDWFGEPARDGMKERPGAMARLAQLENNGGSSIKDTVERIETKLAGVSEQANHAVIAAGLAVNEAKVGRKVMAEAHAENVADLMKTRAMVEEVNIRSAEQAEVATIQRGLITQAVEDMGTKIRTEIDERTAAAYRLLVEHGGPDLSQPVPVHTHEVSPPLPLTDHEEHP